MALACGMAVLTVIGAVAAAAAAKPLEIRAGSSDENWEVGRHVCRVNLGNRRASVRELPYAPEGNLPPFWRQRWVSLDRDAASDEFLRACTSRNSIAIFVEDAVANFLRRFLSKTDTNALLRRGEMFVLSTAQAQRLLGERPGGVLLDVGAGSGSITARLAPLFDQVLTTEASGPMATRLERRGFVVHRGEDLGGIEETAAAGGVSLGPGGSVDCVALLNVLDRCDAPLELLAAARRRLKPGTGRLLVAVVLPFRPFVERDTGRFQPSQRLPLDRNASWESSVVSMWDLVLRPAGFELEAVSRVPYLSQGDGQSPVYALDDAILVLRRTEV